MAKKSSSTGVKVSPESRLNMTMTNELRDVLEKMRQDHFAAETRNIGICPLIEQILRESPRVKKTAKEMGIVFPERGGAGAPSKSEEKPD